jgi:hypothetical protein
MVRRYVSALSVSIALHLGVIVGLVWLASQPLASGADDAAGFARARTASASRRTAPPPRAARS